MVSLTADESTGGKVRGNTVPKIAGKFRGLYPAMNFVKSHFLFDVSGLKALPTERALSVFLVALSAITISVAQTQYSVFDNNRLLSWHWLLNASNFHWFIFYICIALAFSLTVCWLRIRSISAVSMMIILSMVTSVVCWQVPEVIVDSARYFTHAKIIETQGINYFIASWGTQISAWTDLPLTSIIYGILFSLFGESRWAIQGLNCVFFSAAIYLTYAIGKLLWNDKVGLYAGLLLLAIPYLHIQTALMLVDVATMFFFCLALWLSLLALRNRNGALTVIAGISVVFALLSKYSAWLIIPLIMCLPLTLHPENFKKGILRALLIDALAIALILVLLLLTGFSIQQQIELLLNYQWTGLSRWQESPISTFFFQMHPFVSLAALFSVLIALLHQDKKYFSIAWPIVILLIVGVNRARYLIVVYPLLALMAAYGVHHFRGFVVQKYFVASAVLISLLTTVFLNIPFLLTNTANNLKLAGEYINSLQEESVIIVAAPQTQSIINPAIAVPILDYFSHKDMHYAKLKGDKISVSNTPTRLSPLRFTWEQKPFPYREVALNEYASNSTIVLVSNSVSNQLIDEFTSSIPGYALAKQFTLMDKVFRYQTLVSIFRYTENEQVK